MLRAEPAVSGEPAGSQRARRDAAARLAPSAAGANSAALASIGCLRTALPTAALVLVAVSPGCSFPDVTYAVPAAGGGGGEPDPPCTVPDACADEAASCGADAAKEETQCFQACPGMNQDCKAECSDARDEAEVLCVQACEACGADGGCANGRASCQVALN
jgi:hypothetical protein